jgi:hypothetical protein
VQHWVLSRDTSILAHKHKSFSAVSRRPCVYLSHTMDVRARSHSGTVPKAHATNDQIITLATKLAKRLHCGWAVKSQERNGCFCSNLKPERFKKDDELEEFIYTTSGGRGQEDQGPRIKVASGIACHACVGRAVAREQVRGSHVKIEKGEPWIREKW